MLSSPSLVTVRSLSKKYCTNFRTSLWYGLRDIAAEALPNRRAARSLRPAEFWSLRDVSFELRRGEALAIIGDNGAGKSTLLKLLNGLIKPDAGSIRILGRLGALIELGAGLDPLLSGRENIFLRAALLGVSRAQVRPLLQAIIDFTGLGEAIEMPVQFYSSGMVSRLAYAVAAHLHPDVLLVDEVLAVGDFDFQRKCIQHMMGYLAAGGSLILVSHQAHHVQAVCQRGLVLEKGRVAFAGTATDALDYYFAQQVSGAAPAGERTARPPSPAHPVALEQVELAGPGPDIAPHDDVTVTLSYHALHRVEGVSWGFNIFTPDGTLCITSVHLPRPTVLLPGRHRLRCRLPRLALTAGEYLVKAVLFDLETFNPYALLGWEDAPVRLRITAGPSKQKNVEKMLHQLVTIDVEWNQ